MGNNDGMAEGSCSGGHKKRDDRICYCGIREREKTWEIQGFKPEHLEEWGGHLPRWEEC